jgi:signal peptidase I
MTNEIQTVPASTEPAGRVSATESPEPTTDGDSGEPGGRRSRSRGRSVALFARDILFIFLAALVISFIIKTFFIRSFYIPSPSMTNTLQVNDRVIVSLLTPGLTPLKHGDVVVFTDPGGWLPSEHGISQPDSWVTDALAFIGLAAPDDNDHLIKRVIGLPGDHVACCSADGKLTINGVAITEPYINVPAGDPADKFQFSITVPKGELWVMGDNRNDSADSAYHESIHDLSPFVPISAVTGRAMLVSWPASHWTYLNDYPDVFKNVDAKEN